MTDSKLPTPFARQPKVFLLDPDIKPEWAWLHTVMISYADYHTGDNCKCSLSKLATRKGLDRRTVQRWADELEARGWIIRDSQRGKANIITVIRDPEKAAAVVARNADKITDRKRKDAELKARNRESSLTGPAAPAPQGGAAPAPQVPAAPAPHNQSQHQRDLPVGGDDAPLSAAASSPLARSAREAKTPSSSPLPHGSDVAGLCKTNEAPDQGAKLKAVRQGVHVERTDEATPDRDQGYLMHSIDGGLADPREIMAKTRTAHKEIMALVAKGKIPAGRYEKLQAVITELNPSAEETLKAYSDVADGLAYIGPDGMPVSVDQGGGQVAAVAS